MTVLRKEDADKSERVIVRDQRNNIIKVVNLQDQEIGTSTAPKDQIIWGDLDVQSQLTVLSSGVFGSSIFVSGALSASKVTSSQITGSITQTNLGTSFITSVSNQVTVTTSSLNQVQIGSTLISMTLTSDFTTTSTTPQSSSFSFPVSANEIWEVEFDGSFGCSTANGVQVGWAAPAGSTGNSRVFGCTTSATTFSSSILTTMNALMPFTFSNVSGPAPRYGRVQTLIRVGSSAGSITMLMGVVTLGTARMYADSYFTARRVSSV